jgi:hypothetical protein
LSSGTQVSRGELFPTSCVTDSSDPTAAEVSMSSKAGR